MKTLPPRISIELTFGCNHRCLFCSCPWLRHAGLAGRALEHPELLLQDTQYDRLLKTARMLKTMLKLPLYFSYEKRCECYELDGTPTGTVPESCTAGKDFAVISPDGTLRKCMHSPEKICSFDEFLHKEKV